MGVFDDAIREHLELKRRSGASDEEVDRELDKALGRPGPAAYQEPAVTADEPAAGDDQPAMPAEEEIPAEAPADEEPEAGRPADFAAELDPDEVLPEEALESPAVGDFPNGRPAPALEDEDLPEDDAPDSVEESSDQDRLWFEQKPPKDFDFDD